jgi:hypothetical protein
MEPGAHRIHLRVEASKLRLGNANKEGLERQENFKCRKLSKFSAKRSSESVEAGKPVFPVAGKSFSHAVVREVC